MKKGTWVPITIFALVMAAVGYGLWYGSQVYIPKLNAEKVAAIRAEQAAEAEATRLAEEKDADTVDAAPYDYSIPISEDALRKQRAAEAYDPDDAISVTTDENGDVWITRDWSNAEGLNVAEPPDAEADQSPAKANIAGEAGEIPTDENGVYSENIPEPASKPTTGSPKPSSNPTPSTGDVPDTPETPASSGNGGSGNGDNGGSSSGSNTAPAGNGGSGSGGGTGGGSGTPKQGDIKYVDGQMYRYNSIAGWLPSGDQQSYSTHGAVTATELGERVENANF